jgi:hypothetical protein
MGVVAREVIMRRDCGRQVGLGWMWRDKKGRVVEGKKVREVYAVVKDRSWPANHR